MNQEYDVAVVGASGMIGEAMMSILEERNFPVRNIYPLGSERSAGTALEFHGETVHIGLLSDFDFSHVQYGLFSAGAGISDVYARKAVDQDCTVIDNTSRFRYDPDIPLVIPEVNGEVLSGRDRLIANPNCSTIQMLVALKPIYDAAGIDRINVCTYQSVSGAGRSAVEELAEQSAALLSGRDAQVSVAPRQIAFNAIPHIDVFQENGYTKEEMKMVWETRKILNDDTIRVNPTTVRIPVFFGHSEAVHIETKQKITAAQARELLRSTEGITVIDDPDGLEYPTAVTDAANRDDVFVGRIREDISHEHGLNMWVVSDNVRKGGALNSIQIAEYLINAER
ncbi:MAG: aspartate-semialdehyde dehydrogenase [Acidiferrobacterales bacterium]|nr:aspartate-semialdehyde dehydrogenase [Acidiferrobacterales bacterium]